MPRRRVALLRRPNVSGPGAPAPQPFTPADLPGLVTWLQPTAQGTLRGDPTGTYTGALDDNTAIIDALSASEARLSQWNGSGGTGNFVQATEAAQPWWLQGYISAFPAADFRDGQVMLSVANGSTFWPAAQTTVAELAVVVKAVGAWAQGHILSLNQADATNALQIRVTTSIQWAYRDTGNSLTAISAPLPSVDEPHELRLVKTATGVFGFIDGVEVASASDARGPIFASGGAVPITLGGRSNLTNGFDGAISEVTARNVVLTPQQRLRESNYLQIKYSAPSSLDAPAFTDGTLFSDGTAFTDTPQTTPTIAVSQSTTGPGGIVQIAVAGGPGRVLDWVGVFLQEATSPDNRLAWQYLNGSQTPPSIPIRSATLSFTMPFAPGQYVLRFYTTVGAQHTLLASTNVVNVQEVTGGVYAPGVYEAGVYGNTVVEIVALAGAYEDPVQSEVPFGKWSLYKTPWRAFVDAWPVSRFDNGLAMYMWNTHGGFLDAHRTPLAQLFAEIGIKSARVEVGWDSLDYDDPSSLTASLTPVITARLQILQAAGIRPLILLNSNHGVPCPRRNIAVTMASASSGATSVTFSGPNLAQIRPHYTGFPGTYGKGAYPLITSINTGTGVATLSAPLPSAHAGGSFDLMDLKFHPFSGPTLSGGVPNPFSEETYQGWLTYAAGVLDFAAGVLGSTEFDVEIWNEMSFGSDFLREWAYYSPARTWDEEIPTYTNHGLTVGGATATEHIDVVLARTVDLIRDPANGWTNVRVINGFANTSPFWVNWPGLHGYSHHYYQALQPDPLPTDGSYKADQQAIAADGTLEQPGWVPANLTWGLPEYWYYAYQTESLHHELVPWPSIFPGHGRYEYLEGLPGFSRALGVWQTECNTYRTLWLEEIRIAEGLAEDSPALVALNHHQAAKLVLRNYVFNIHQGLERLFLYGEHPPEYGFEFLPAALYPLLTSKSYVVDDEVRAACGEQYHTLKRFRAAMIAGADATIDTARKLEVTGVWEHTPRKVWTGDSTVAHPDRWNREDLAILPFMVNATKWAIPCYVVTRDGGASYDLTKGLLDPLRYRFPPQTFEIQLSNLRGSGAVVSLYDPLTDETFGVGVIAAGTDLIMVQLSVTDYPRILFITESTAGALIKDVAFDVTGLDPQLSFTTNVAAAPVVSWGSLPARTSGGSTTLPSGTAHSITLDTMGYTDNVKVEVDVGGIVARWPIWPYDVQGQWQYYSEPPTIALPEALHTWDFEQANLSIPLTFTRADANLFLPDYQGVWRGYPANLAPMQGFRMINHGTATDYGWGVAGWEFRADEPGGAPLTNERGFNPQPAQTNLVTAAKSNPGGTANCTLTGPGVLSVVDDSAQLGAALAVFGPNVFRINNSAGGSTTYVRFGGGTTDTTRHNLSAFVRGQGSLLLYDGTTETGAQSFNTTSYIRLVAEDRTPAAGLGQEFCVSVPAGQTVHLVMPQLERNIRYASAPIPGGTGTIARAGMTCQGPAMPSSPVSVYVAAIAPHDFVRNQAGGARMFNLDLGGVLIIPGEGNVRSYDGASDVNTPNNTTQGQLYRAAVTAQGTTRTIVLNGGTPGSGTYNADQWAGRTVWLGTTNSGEWPHANALLKQVLVYDEAMSADQLFELTTNGPGSAEGPAALVARGLLHEYRFDEGSGQVLTDYHGTADGQLGATTGAEASDPTWTTTGLSFDGTTDYVLTPAATNISNRTTWTLCVMLKGAAQQDRRFYSEGSTASGNQVGLFASGNASNTNKPRVFFRDSSGAGLIDLHFDTVVFDNTWRFLAFKRNGTSISCFNNGTFLTSTIGFGVMDVALNRTVIGALSPTSTWWAGEIGWIAKYDVDLTDQEILDNQSYAQALMDSRIASIPINTVLPAISGDLMVGQILTCSTGTWTNFPTSYSYQWKLGVSNIGTNQNTHVTSATGNYTCVVTATNSLGSSDPATAPAVTVTAGGDAIIAGVNLAGADFGSVPGTYGADYVYPSNAEADYFLNRGFKRIRVPFRWERLQPTLGGALNATELGRLKPYINYIADQGGSPIVDPHNYAGYTLSGTNYKIGSAQVTIAHYRNFWERLAAEFAADSRIIFCLMNEPNGLAIGTWMNAANQAIQGIRSVGATSQIIQVSGIGHTAVHTFLSLDAGEEFLAQVTDPNNNLEIEVHMYLDSDNVGDSADVSSDVVGPIRMGPFTQWCRRKGFKAHLGEWNGGDNSSTVNSTPLQAVREVHDYLRRNADVWRGYTMWAGGPWWAESYLHDLEPIGGVGGATPRLRISELQARSKLKISSYPGAVLALDFAYADYQGATLGSVLSLAQAGSTLKLDPTTGAFSTVSANTLRIVPRWGLLTEEARSNYSPHIMTPSTLTNLISTGGQAAPDGTNDAVRLIENTALGAHITLHDNTVTARSGLAAGDVLTISAWAKLITGQAERWAWCYWGTPDSNATQGLRLRSWAADSMVAGVGDWFRVTRTFTATGIGSLIKFGLQPDASPGAGHTADSYTGDGASGIHWWGVQVEKGGFPTLPIKNTNLTTKMDRAADELSLTGLALTTIQGAAFTLVLEVMYIPEYTGQSYTLFNLNSTVALRINGNRTIGGDVGTTQTTAVAGSAAAFTQSRKVAISVRRSAGRVVIAAEGSAGAVVGADVTVPATTTAKLGPVNGYIRSMQLYDTFNDTTALTALVRG